MSEERRARFEEQAAALVEPLRRFLLRRTDPDTAEDVLAETLLVCWRRLDDLPTAPPGPLPWAYGVARHCLANAERGERRRTRLAARVATLDPPPVAAPSADPGDPRVRVALDDLDEADAELLRLWAWEGLEPRELATVLAITPNAASVRLHRARARLRERLGDAGERPGTGNDHGTSGHEGVRGGRPR